MVIVVYFFVQSKGILWHRGMKDLQTLIEISTDIVSSRDAQLEVNNTNGEDLRSGHLNVPVNGVSYVNVLDSPAHWIVFGRNARSMFKLDFDENPCLLSKVKNESVFWHRRIVYLNRMDLRKLKDASACNVSSLDAEIWKNSVNWNLIHSVFSELVGIYCVLCQLETVFENWRNGVFDCLDSCSEVQRNSHIQLDGRRKASTCNDIVWLIESIWNAARIEKDVFWTEIISVGNNCLLNWTIQSEFFENATEVGKASSDVNALSKKENRWSQIRRNFKVLYHSTEELIWFNRRWDFAENSFRVVSWNLMQIVLRFLFLTK